MFFNKLVKATKLALLVMGGFYTLTIILKWAVPLVFTGDAGDLYVKDIPSPDGVYFAQIVYDAGGGAISPFCFASVVIHLGRLDIRTYKDYDKYQVYVGDCDNFKDAPAPAVVWTQNRAIEIRFAT